MMIYSKYIVTLQCRQFKWLAKCQ